MKPRLSAATIATYRAGVVLGITALLFLQREYVGRREFEQYKAGHEEWGREVTRRLEGRLDRIERKLDMAKIRWWGPVNWPAMGTTVWFTNEAGAHYELQE